jgi:hypothetical protein
MSEKSVVSQLNEKLSDALTQLLATQAQVRELQAERDGLAAIVANLRREGANGRPEWNGLPDPDAVGVILAQSPADALTAHDAEVAAKALEDAAAANEHEALDEPYAGATFEAHAAWLRDRAKAIRDGSAT